MTDKTAVPGTEPRVVTLPARDAMTADMDAMDRDLPQMERYYQNRARLYRSFYDALLAQGFDHESALELCGVEL